MARLTVPTIVRLCVLVVAWWLFCDSSRASQPQTQPKPERQPAATSRGTQSDITDGVAELLSLTIKQAIRKISPSVVHIEAEHTGDPLRPGSTTASKVEETGAGVIVKLDQHFYVLTNRHVVAVAPPEQITIRMFDGSACHPEKVLSDPDTDIAILKLPPVDAIAAEIGNSDHVEIGDFVLAVGSPFGLSYSVSHGIISGKGRRGLKLGSRRLRIQDFLQTDAAVNPGNSGGPLVNLRGQVIGINTAIASNSGGSEGVAFAIPINLAIHVAKQLAEHGRVRWGYLGVTVAARFSQQEANQLGLERPKGALVVSVETNGPADQAGIRPRDVILKVGSVDILDDKHLVSTVGLLPLGTTVPVTIWRNGKQLVLEATIAERPYD